MSNKLNISDHLSAVLKDWQVSRVDFLKNVYLQSYWPIPFFGNPATATVATIGVNPSSDEFHPARNWNAVQSTAAWKRRLKDYFNSDTPPHRWFYTWQIALELLGISYRAGTAAHFDVSYRPTKAMLRNKGSDHEEFRRMVERDIAWFFRLLPLCERLRMLLVFGPIVRKGGNGESLVRFLRQFAPLHGFTVSQSGDLRQIGTGRTFFIHEADMPDEKCITCRVVKNVYANRDRLRNIIKG